MNILFVMEPRYEAGSIQAVANYIRTGGELGHRIAIYGRPRSDYPWLRFSTDVGSFNYVVFIYESNLYWPKAMQLARIVSATPRRRRAVFDADGMYNPLLVIDGYDRNHWSEKDRQEWLAHFGSLGARVFQPTLGRPREPQARAVPFYGFDPAQVIPAEHAPPKVFDIALVGHNWWRWEQVSKCLLPEIERIRSQVGEICFIGFWWDAVQAWARHTHWEAAYRVDPERLRSLGIQIRPPVPFQEVVRTMSQAKINIMTQRPLLRRLKHLTSKYFECFCADTVPLAMIDAKHSELVYGPAGSELTLNEHVGDKILDVLARPERYRELVGSVRNLLKARHNYRNRVNELLAALQADS